jgi:hypothetical protein
MSDPENFLSRWSRRKREVAEESTPEKAPAESKAPDSAQVQQPEQAPGGETAPFDLSTLPPIESITAETDIRGFFAPGVPVELTRAALRRAWVADPQIRDFVGLADYDFDFNTPGAIPGFGSLQMSDELRREVARIIGGLPAEPPAAVSSAEQAVPLPKDAALPPAGQALPAAVPQAHAESKSPEPAEFVQRRKGSVAPQQDDPPMENMQRIAGRSHGGALPK